MTLESTPADATPGATVRGVRLAALDESTFAALERAWHAFAVLRLSGQHLSEAVQVAFSRRFGPLERSLTARHVGSSPGIIVLSNVREDGSDQGLLPKGNNEWHTDGACRRVPAKGAALSAKIVPDSGGATALSGTTTASRPRASPDQPRRMVRTTIAGDGAANEEALPGARLGADVTVGH